MPKTRYARSPNANIAYHVVGEGPLDIVLVEGWVGHIEGFWEEAGCSRFLSSLAGFSRLILFDKRGTGLSDPVPATAVPTLEERMDDVRLVMDAVGSERAAFFGHWEGGPMSLLFAATYPERTRALILYGAYASWVQRPPEYPWGVRPESVDKILAATLEGWGTDEFSDRYLQRVAPSMANDAAFRRWSARFLRYGCSPSAAAAMVRMAREVDVRAILPAVRVPTLVLHRTGDRAADIGAGRFLAAHISAAEFVELPGNDHLFWVGDQDAIVAEIERFLTGSVRSTPPADRVLYTVLFTDIVGSTEQASRLGDQGWRDLLGAYYASVRRLLGRFRGREVKTTGDGFLVVFDGPARAISCAHAILHSGRDLGIETRAGLHTGECEVMGADIAGLGVHIGARIAAKASAGEVLVSRTVKDLVAGSGLVFHERGAHALKGVPGTWELYEAGQPRTSLLPA